MYPFRNLNLNRNVLFTALLAVSSFAQAAQAKCFFTNTQSKILNSKQDTSIELETLEESARAAALEECTDEAGINCEFGTYSYLEAALNYKYSEFSVTATYFIVNEACPETPAGDPMDLSHSTKGNSTSQANRTGTIPGGNTGQGPGNHTLIRAQGNGTVPGDGNGHGPGTSVQISAPENGTISGDGKGKGWGNPSEKQPQGNGTVPGDGNGQGPGSH